MLVVCLDVDMATGWQQHHLIRQENPHFLFCLPVVNFLQHMYTYIYNP